MSVREAQERVSADEFTYWMVYDKLDPIGNDRAAYQSALIAHTVASTHSKKKLKLENFLLKFGDEPKALTDPKKIFKYFQGLQK
tara:strand:+ start:14061 stop:14312 length:252 start_codon:yes stop_codon:yes gene_type:complete